MSTTSLSREAIPTWAEVIRRIDAQAELPHRRRQDLASAVRRFCRFQGCRPEDLVADPADLRRRLRQMSPAATGLSPGAFRNLRSLVNHALIATGVISLPRRSRTPLTPEWREVLEAVEDRHRRDSLGHFA